MTAQFLGSGAVEAAAETWPSFALTQMAPASTSVPWLGDTQPGQDLVVDSSQQDRLKGPIPVTPDSTTQRQNFKSWNLSQRLCQCVAGWIPLGESLKRQSVPSQL